MGIKAVIKRTGDKNAMTLVEAFDEFILEKQSRNLSNRTIKNYQEHFEIFKRDMKINEFIYCEEIDIKVIQYWIAELKKRVNIESVNSYVKTIRAVLYWCMDEERKYISTPYKIYLLKNQEEPPKHYTKEEIEIITQKPFKGAPFGEWRNWAVICFILGTGARAGSICSIKIENVDFVNKEVSFPHTKNTRALIVPLSPALENVLKEYLRMWRKGASPSDYLFPTIGNTPFTSKTLWYATRNFFRSRGIEKTSVHGLRHTFAIEWIRNKGNPFILQRVLGHSSLQMTRKYVRLYSDDLKPDYELYSPLDNMKKTTKPKARITRSV